MWRWIVLVLAAGVGALIWQWQSAGRGVTVDVAHAQLGLIRTYVEEQAKTRVPEVFEVTMPLQGRILPIELREGDKVTRGQVVAQMETDDLDTDVIKKQSQVDRLVQAFASIANRRLTDQLKVAASKARFEFNKLQEQRQKDLFAKEATTEVNMQQAELNRIQAENDLRSDEVDAANTALWEAGLRLFEAEYKEDLDQARRDRARAEIHSPVDGTVLSKTVSNEKVLSAGTVLLEVGDMSQLEIEADVLTQDVVRVRVGDPVSIEGPSIGPEPITGQVSRIFPRGFTKVSSLGVEQQRVKVIMSFDTSGIAKLQQGGRQLGVDYRLRVRIFTDAKGDAVKIPRSAIFRNAAGNWQAFVVRDGRARLIDVEVGLTNDMEVEITAGVNEGDAVIVAPPADLASGDPVRPLEWAGMQGQDK
jgi:HlyD family secretion protein